MTMDGALLNTAISSLYFASSVFLILFISGATPAWTRRAGFVLGVAGFAAHTAQIAVLLFSGGTLAGGLARSLFLFSWFTAIAFLCLGRRARKSSLGAFVFTLAFIATLPSAIPSGGGAEGGLVMMPLIRTHVALILLGMAFFFIAFVAALLYLFREKRIKSGSLPEDRDNSLLPIVGLDRVQHITLFCGFPLVTLGIALGFLSASQAWGADWLWGKKETFSVATWLIYAVLINGRLAHGWRGRKSSFGAIAGFIAAAAVFFASYYLIPGRHTF
ncbi:MAG: cytochrome C assembly family protein [Thermodesulfobacteriota bacterium]